MKIRNALKSDLDKVLELNQAAIPHVSSETREEMEFLFTWADPFWVVEQGDELAGFMIVLQKGVDYPSLNYDFFCGNYSDFDYVDRIVISEKYQGKRMGTALYKHLFETSDKKMITCEVNINPPNPRSMGFHKKLGFKKVAEQKTEKGQKSVAMMVKRL